MITTMTVTEKELKKLFLEFKKELIHDFKDIIIKEIKGEIVTKKAFDEEITSVKNTITQLDQRVNILEKNNKDLCKQNDVLKLKVHNLKWKLEDRTNWEMRKTLIIKGVPEVNEDSWDKTENALAASISNVCNIDQDSAKDMFERVHRGCPK